MTIWIIERRSGRRWCALEIVAAEQRGQRIRTLREAYPLSAFRLVEYRPVTPDHIQG